MMSANNSNDSHVDVYNPEDPEYRGDSYFNRRKSDDNQNRTYQYSCQIKSCGCSFGCLSIIIIIALIIWLLTWLF